MSMLEISLPAVGRGVDVMSRMGRPRLLNYERIAALRGQGLSYKAIALAVGHKESSVVRAVIVMRRAGDLRCTAKYRRVQAARPSQKGLRITFTAPYALNDKAMAAASARMRSVSMLVRDLFLAALQDDLMDAVLDDK